MAVPIEPSVTFTGPPVTQRVYLSQENANFPLGNIGGGYFWFVNPLQVLPQVALQIQAVVARVEFTNGFAELMCRFTSKDTGYQWYGFSKTGSITERLFDIIPRDLQGVIGFAAKPLDSDPAMRLGEAWLEVTYQLVDPTPPLPDIPAPPDYNGFADNAVGGSFSIRQTGEIAVAGVYGAGGNISAAGDGSRMYFGAAPCWAHDRKDMWIAEFYTSLGYSPWTGFDDNFTLLIRAAAGGTPFHLQQQGEGAGGSSILGTPLSTRDAIPHSSGWGSQFTLDAMCRIGGGLYLVAHGTLEQGVDPFHSPSYYDDPTPVWWHVRLNVCDADGVPTGPVIDLGGVADTGFYGDIGLDSNGSVILVTGYRPTKQDPVWEDWTTTVTAVDLDTGAVVGRWTRPGFAGGIAYVGGGKALLVYGADPAHAYEFYVMQLVDALTGKVYMEKAGSAFSSSQVTDGSSQLTYLRNQPDNPQAGGILCAKTDSGLSAYTLTFYEVRFTSPPLRQATRDDWLGGDSERARVNQNEPTSEQESIRQFGPPNTYA